MQVKLLRVLDGAPYYRLGGVRKVAVDVRIVAATNQNLEEMGDDGRFRCDLYHRLSQITLRVPPLRERPEDIVPLAEHFLSEIGQHRYFTSDALSLLKSYHWPGNIRELRNVVTKAGVMTIGHEIHSTDLGPEVARRPIVREMFVVDKLENPNLDGVEQRIIMQVLAKTNGRQQRAAELLGISRRTLIRKLKAYEVESTRRSCDS
jgi:DNA-binding NtrC family response regulator